MIQRAGIIHAVALICLTSGTTIAVANEYKGLCEASAGAYIDDNHFIVASDETNVLYTYKRGQAEPINKVDLEDFTGFDKSDIEGAARIGDKVYWISSHSFNSRGEDKKKRRIFFATKTSIAGGSPVAEGFGKPATGLRDGIASAARVAPNEMNVEGLAATTSGGLLIGLRAPLRDNRAIIVSLENPAAVVEGTAPKWGATTTVDLGGRGIRSMELIAGKSQYLIVAGPLKDSDEPFKLFTWSGADAAAEPLDAIKLTGIRPEGAMQLASTGTWHLISDDGDVCSDEDDAEAKRKFRTVDVQIP